MRGLNCTNFQFYLALPIYCNGAVIWKYTISKVLIYTELILPIQQPIVY